MDKPVVPPDTTTAAAAKSSSLCSQYVQKIVDLYVAGKDNAYEVFIDLSNSLGKGSSCYDQNLYENDLDYVKRCAALDFHDGSTQGAVYQEVWDDLMRAQA